MDHRIRARRREVVRARARRRRRVTMSVVSLVVLVAAGVAVSHSPLFAVDSVEVVGVGEELTGQVRSAAGVRPGQRLLGVDLELVEARVSGLPWVREVEARRSPPSTVIVELTVREPVAVVRTDSEAWLVDADGVVVAGGNDEALVIIDAPGAVLPDAGREVADLAVRNALAVHARLPGPLRAGVVRYEAPSDRGLRFHLELGHPSEEGIWVRFGTAERTEDKAQVLGLMLDQLRQLEERDGQLTAVAEVDVRAPDNPVLVTASP